MHSRKLKRVKSGIHIIVKRYDYVYNTFKPRSILTKSSEKKNQPTRIITNKRSFDKSSHIRLTCIRLMPCRSCDVIRHSLDVCLQAFSKNDASIEKARTRRPAIYIYSPDTQLNVIRCQHPAHRSNFVSCVHDSIGSFV